MATDQETKASAEGFGHVSRIRGSIFKAVLVVASFIGVVALGILLVYVSFDAFQLLTADSTWYLAYAGLFGLPVLGFVFYSLMRDPGAGRVAASMVTTFLASSLLGLSLVVFFTILNPTAWFGYFLAAVAPPLLLLVVSTATGRLDWGVLGVILTALAGVVVGTVFLEPLSMVGELLTNWLIYYVTLLLPVAVLMWVYLRRNEDEALEYAFPGLLLLSGFVGTPAFTWLTGLDAALWLIFLLAPVLPTSAVLWRLRGREALLRGLLGIGLIVAGLALATVAVDILGFGAPESWLDWGFLTNSHSNTAENAGIYPALVGSALLMVVVSLVSFPLGVGAAIYMEEYAPDNKLTRLIRINISNLAGVPSIVYGLLGLGIFVNLVGLGYGTVLAGGVTLALLILPIVIISSREAIRSVPDSHRQASYGMGATKWQTVGKVVLPQAIPGILTGTILSLGRAIGETAPLIMIGAPHVVFSTPTGLGDKVSAMPMQIFIWSEFPSRAFQYGVVAAGVVTLLVVLLTMNSVAIYLRDRHQKKLR